MKDSNVLHVRAMKEMPWVREPVYCMASEGVGSTVSRWPDTSPRSPEHCPSALCNHTALGLPDAGNTVAHKACCPELFLCSSACKCWVLHEKLQNKGKYPNITINYLLFHFSRSMEKVNEYMTFLLIYGLHHRTFFQALTDFITRYFPQLSHRHLHSTTHQRLTREEILLSGMISGLSLLLASITDAHKL